MNQTPYAGSGPVPTPEVRRRIEQVIRTDHPIVLFDGVCASCNRVVDILLRLDRRGRFRFLALQTPLGQALQNRFGIPAEPMETLVLVHRGSAYLFSGAVFQILLHLGWPWRILRAFRLMPERLTDGLYRLFARNRYRLFGRRAACRIPSAAELGRFLEGGL